MADFCELLRSHAMFVEARCIDGKTIAEDIRQAAAIIDEHLHQRTCYGCGNVAWHRDNVAGYVRCLVCSSMDTRRKRKGGD